MPELCRAVSTASSSGCTSMTIRLPIFTRSMVMRRGCGQYRESRIAGGETPASGARFGD